MAGKFKNGIYKILGLEDVADNQNATPAPVRSTQAGKYSGAQNLPRGEERAQPNAGRSPGQSRLGYAESPTAARQPARRAEAQPVVSLPQAVSQPQAQAAGGAVQMIVYQLQSYDDTQRVVDELNSGRTVIVSTERLKRDTAQRALDFIGGAIYTLNGNHRKIARGIFVFAPANVDISGSYANVLPPEMRRPR